MCCACALLESGGGGITAGLHPHHGSGTIHFIAQTVDVTIARACMALTGAEVLGGREGGRAPIVQSRVSLSLSLSPVFMFSVLYSLLLSLWFLAAHFCIFARM